MENHDAEIERRVQERVAAALDGIPDLLAIAVERGVRRVLDDESVRERFWAAGYTELEKHAGTNVAQWLGRRIVNIIVTAAVAGLLAWVVMSGRIK